MSTGLRGLYIYSRLTPVSVAKRKKEKKEGRYGEGKCCAAGDLRRNHCGELVVRVCCRVLMTI